jgi:hypothetical protein
LQYISIPMGLGIGKTQQEDKDERL